jgi:hypothetical protein
MTNKIYLSPAFRKRPEADLQFLRGIDGTTGFSLFWIDIVRPLLVEIKTRSLLEIGADQGAHSRLLLEYCNLFEANLTVIEPAVSPSLQAIVNKSPRVRLYAKKSQEAIPLISSPIDVVLLEGDLNYSAVLGDLNALHKLSRKNNFPFPVVFARTSWPYARRDMYYDPDNMPEAERREYARRGMTPWSRALQENMINSLYANAETEGGPKNGVLTAMEDFISTCDTSLRLFSLPVNHGLGIIYSTGSVADKFISDNLSISPLFGDFLETMEIARINNIIVNLQSQRFESRIFQIVRKSLSYFRGR